MSDNAAARDVPAWCERNGVRTLVVGTSDTHGAWVGKRVDPARLPSLLDGPGLAFSNVIFVLARDGRAAVEPRIGLATYFPRKDNGYPDIFLRPDPATARALPWDPGTAALNGTFVTPDGSDLPLAPRNVLARQAGRAAALDLEVRFGAEFEFYLLQGQLADLAETGHPVEPLSPRPYTYLAGRPAAGAAVLGDIRDGLEGAGISVEAVSAETGPSQYEVNVGFREARQAGDDAFLYKNAVKQIAAARGLSATFMAKPGTALPGSGCHLHQSLWRAGTGEPLTWARYGPLTGTARQYLAGLLDTMAEFAVLFAPTVNAYKRLVPYSWAATTATWAVGNRSAGVRLVGDSPATCRLEHRLGGADVNPYLAMAACLAGGLHGIEKGLEPPRPYHGDAYANPTLPQLPKSLAEAVDRFEASETARAAFGDDFVEHFAAMKRWEDELYRRSVTDWEVQHYVGSA